MTMQGQIKRYEQLRLLKKGLTHPLTLIVAAAGSGKSVLLNQWINAEAHRSDGPRIINLDVSTRCNESRSLFQRLFSELRNVAPLWDASLFNLFKTEKPIAPDVILDVLLSALESIETDLVLVFDDFHLVQSAEIQRIFSDLIYSLPSNVRLVLSTRMYPLFSLSRLKLEEKVFVIDGNDLRLKEEEVVELNQRIGGEPLDEARVSGLLHQTEGWFVGIKLALLAYDRAGEHALDTFNGSQPELLNYFGYEVLKNLTPEFRQFILATVLFDTFDAALCEAVLGIQDSAWILEKLAAQELFLVSVPGAPGFYRYHALLQEFLLGQLALEYGKEYIHRLHRLAADYYLKAQNYVSALRHASASEDSEYFYGILRNACDHWLRQGEFELVIESLAEVDDEQIGRRPDLLVPITYALIFSRRFNQAHYYIDMLKQHSQSVTGVRDTEEEVDNPLTIESFIEHLLLLFQREDLAFSDPKVVELALQHPCIDVRALAMLIVSYERLYRGRLNQAFRTANQAKALLAKIGHKFLESCADLVIVLCDRYLGRGDNSVQMMAKAYACVENSPGSPVWVNIATGMMVVCYEKNDLDNALIFCEKLLPAVNYSCATEVVTNVYLYLSRLWHLKGEKKKATKLLGQLERILSLGNYGRFQSCVVQESMRQALENGQLTIAEGIYTKYCSHTAQEKERERESEYYEERYERNALTAVYWLMSRRKLDQAEKVLLRLVVMLEKHEMKSRGLVARCNLLMISVLRGEREVAVNQLKKLLDEYGPICFSRTVFDETPGLQALFQDAISQQRIVLPKLYLELFHNILFPVDSTQQDINPRTVLTEKEMEIFELLGSGLSNADISKEAKIALSTTKWHLKNIYAKLGVANRSAAVRLAYQQ